MRSLFSNLAVLLFDLPAKLSAAMALILSFASSSILRLGLLFVVRGDPAMFQGVEVSAWQYEKAVHDMPATVAYPMVLPTQFLLHQLN